jgi:replicative DNA helicase
MGANPSISLLLRAALIQKIRHDGCQRVDGHKHVVGVVRRSNIQNNQRTKTNQAALIVGKHSPLKLGKAGTVKITFFSKYSQ